MTAHFRCVLLYLSMRTFLQRGLYHNVALHAHLQLRDLGRYTAVTRGPQRSQELPSSDRVYYHGPILKQKTIKTDILVCKSAITQCFCFYFYSVTHEQVESTYTELVFSSRSGSKLWQQ